MPAMLSVRGPMRRPMTASAQGQGRGDEVLADLDTSLGIDDEHRRPAVDLDPFHPSLTLRRAPGEDPPVRIREAVGRGLALPDRVPDEDSPAPRRLVPAAPYTAPP